MQFFKILFVAILAYIAATPLSSNISMDLTQTNWFSLWTYLIWACSLGIWWLFVLAGIFIISALASR